MNSILIIEEKQRFLILGRNMDYDWEVEAFIDRLEKLILDKVQKQAEMSYKDKIFRCNMRIGL